jgi:hypothetical protein
MSVAFLALAILVPTARAQNEPAVPKDQAPGAGAAPEAKVAPLPGPEPIPPFELPMLRTVPTDRNRPGYNVQMVDASLLPRDKEGIWVLDFAYKPVRITNVEIPGKGRRLVHYMYYRIINHTGQPRKLVPQFSLVTDTQKRYEETVLPQAVATIQNREDPTIPVLGAVSIMGTIPASTRQGVDDAIYGVAVWEGVDPKADRFSIYVRGLSDGYQLVKPPGGDKPVVRFKTLRIDFLRPGDERNISEREIQAMDPPYEWVYW